MRITDLLYRGTQLPIVEIKIADVRGVESEGVTVIVEGAGPEAANSEVTVSVSIIEPTFGTVAPPSVKLPTIRLEKSHIPLLNEDLKLALAHYFVPEKLNAILARVIARSRH